MYNLNNKTLLSVFVSLVLLLTVSNAQADFRSLTISKFVSSANGLDVLEFALEAEGLLETLNDRHGRFTLFAPTNEAFQSLADVCTNGDIGALANALIDAGLLDDVLLYHVVDFRISARRIVTRGTLPTLVGQDLTSGIGNGGINIMGLENATPSNIVSSVIRVRNGFIYPIDQVLLNADPTPLCIQ